MKLTDQIKTKISRLRMFKATETNITKIPHAMVEKEIFHPIHDAFPSSL